MHTMPDDALRAILEFLYEVKDKLGEIQYDLRVREAKIDPDTLNEIAQKDHDVTEMIGRLRGKVGNVERSGNMQLVGGVAPGFYKVTTDPPTATAEMQHEVSKEELMEMMQEEMHTQHSQISTGQLSQKMQELELRQL